AINIPCQNEKVNIFFGVQTGKGLRKGYYIFEEVIERLCEEYPDRVDVNVVENVPYKEYIRSFKGCHIFFDQALSYDKGMNALIGMAAGKVVLSGAEAGALSCYNRNGCGSPLIN